MERKFPFVLGPCRTALEVLGHKLIGDERDLHDDGDDHDVSNVEKLSRQSGRTPMGEPVDKTLGDAAFQNKDKVHEKPETRPVMVDITGAAVLNTKYEASIKVHQGRELNRYEKPEKREMMIKFCVDTVLKNTLDKDPDKDTGHKKLEKRDVVVCINPEDVCMNNVMDDIINTGMLNTK